MRHYLPILPAILLLASLGACSWMGLGGKEEEAPRSLASLHHPVEESGSEVTSDEESFNFQQTVNCRISAKGPVQFEKNFKFHLDLEQVNQSSWAERVNVGNGLEVYVNLWSFREYTLGLKDVRAPASTESRLVETKGVWSPSYERTVSDLAKVRFQAKLFHHAGDQSFEVRCPE